MQIITTDIAVIGAGGAGLRTAIAAAEANPDLEVALISKVYPMRSHTVAAEGGSAAVIKDEDSLDNHFNDTVGGGDWLCEQDVVEYFVENATREMIQMEQWGCPWSRKENGEVNVRRFGGMKVERTWFAADKTGFHMLHTLFQTSMKYSNIKRFDEYFVVDLLVDEGEVQGEGGRPDQPPPRRGAAAGAEEPRSLGPRHLCRQGACQRSDDASGLRQCRAHLCGAVRPGSRAHAGRACRAMEAAAPRVPLG